MNKTIAKEAQKKILKNSKHKTLKKRRKLYKIHRFVHIFNFRKCYKITKNVEKIFSKNIFLKYHTTNFSIWLLLYSINYCMVLNKIIKDKIA